MAPSNVSGVHLTITGSSKFFQTLGRVNRAYGQTDKSAGKAARAINNTTKSSMDFVSKVKIAAVLTAIGAAAITAGRALTSMGSDAFESAAGFQELQIRIEGLLARQFRLQDANLSVEDAWRRAASGAKIYLEWIKKIAVTTPFEVGDITETFSLAQAYGFTAKEAQILTLAIGEFTAGMGLGNEVMRRIIENFGQMRAAGKVTGTELRDLARGAFLPVNQIIKRMAENLGVADDEFEAFRKSVAEGGVDVDEFFKAFIQIANEEFPNAMERMSRTWRGVTSNIKDFVKTVLGVELLGPVLNKLSNLAADALDVLLSPSVRDAAALLGDTLAESFQRIWAALNRLTASFYGLLAALGFTVPHVRDFANLIAFLTNVFVESIDTIAGWIDMVANTLSGGLQAAAAAAFQWGVNISVQLAQGLIDGAASAITAAMNYISGLLSHWLSPGSPPLVAPNIDIWGSMAFTEFLRGFASADFGVLSSIQSPLQSALGTLVSLGQISGKGAASLFSSVSLGISAILSGTGSVSSVINQLTSGLGRMGVELGVLLKKQLALVSATKALEEAEEALESARKTEDDAIKKVSALTSEYNALLRAGASPEILEAKLAEINAAEESREAAIAERTEAEAAVELAKERLEPLQEAVKLQQELINQMLKMAQMQTRFAKAKKGGAGFTVPSFGGLSFPEADPESSKVTGKLTKPFDSMGEKIAEALREAGRLIREAWERDIMTPLRNGWSQIAVLFEEKKRELKTLWGAWIADLTLTWAEFVNGLPEGWGQMWGGIVGIWLFWASVFTALWTAFAATIKGVWENDVLPVFNDMGAEIDKLGIDWGAVWAFMGVVVLGFWNFFLFIGQLILGFALLVISAVIGFAVRLISLVIRIVFRVIAEFAKMWSVITSKTTTLKEKLLAVWRAFWTTLWLLFFVRLAILVLLIKGVWDDIKLFTSTFLTDLVKTVTDKIPEFLAAGKGIIGGLLQGMIEGAEAALEVLTGILLGMIEITKQILGLQSPSKVFRKMGQHIMGGLALGMGDMGRQAIEMSGAVTSGVVMAANAPVQAASVSGGSTFNLNVGSINSGMDEASLEATIRRVMSSEF